MFIRLIRFLESSWDSSPAALTQQGRAISPKVKPSVLS